MSTLLSTARKRVSDLWGNYELYNKHANQREILFSVISYL